MQSYLNLDKKGFNGFLPDTEPLYHIDCSNADVAKLKDLSLAIPKLLLTNKIRSQVDKLPSSFFSHDLSIYKEDQEIAPSIAKIRKQQQQMFSIPM